MPNITEERIVRSALWAAYGDIVGFPTELLSEQEFKKRNFVKSIQGPIDWTRRVGGLFGPHISFPIGTYSDDTQLRLSTSRAIRGDGYFDVESFAKVELPVWLNYALGAGKGSKAAAANLCLRESTWSQNFYQNGGGQYWTGGGNGAAMRIQPHVWLGHRTGPKSFIVDVVRNSICTHGHPRAIIGAAIHAQFLYQALATQQAVPPNDWTSIGETAAEQAYESLVDDEELALVWIPNWEHFSGMSLREVWAATVLEWLDCVQKAQEYCSSNDAPEVNYRKLLAELGGFSPAERGSGLKTPLYAAFLAWIFRNDSPETALLVSANTFKSDTDTIGTMAGALIGAVAHKHPSSEIQDAEYIAQEAQRLFRIGSGRKQESFTYPDLLSWITPKSQSGAWIENNGEPYLSGLGKVLLLSQPYASTKGTELLWQWCALSFGQTVLAKRRPTTSKTVTTKDMYSTTQQQRTPTTQVQAQLPMDNSSRDIAHPLENMSIDEHTQICIRSGFDPKVIGESLLSLSQGSFGVEKAIAFAAIIAKAKLARGSR